MKVIDFLEKVSEDAVVNLVYRGEIISYYDGKNSIDEIYNEREVLDIDIEPFDGAFFLTLENPIVTIINDFKNMLNVVVIDDLSGEELPLDTDFSNYDIVGCKDELEIYVKEV